MVDTHADHKEIASIFFNMAVFGSNAKRMQLYLMCEQGHVLQLHP